MAQNKQGRRSKRELRAIAYHLADLIETGAQAIQARDPALSRIDAINRAMAQMVQGRQA